MCRAVLPEMTEHGGVIVNIGSISGVVADLSSALYNASKAFVHALTRSIAIDHGPQVRCNAVLPGWIETDMADEGFDLAQDPAAARADAVRRHPLGRFGRPGGHRQHRGVAGLRRGGVGHRAVLHGGRRADGRLAPAPGGVLTTFVTAPC